MGDPLEIAQAELFLASEEPNCILGAEIAVDGVSRSFEPSRRCFWPDAFRLFIIFRGNDYETYIPCNASYPSGFS